MGHITDSTARLVVAAVLFVAVQPSTCGAATKGAPLADWSTFRAVAVRQLAMTPGYKSGDLITAPNVEPIFDQFRRMGWVIKESRAIGHELLKDKDFIARKLHTKQGRKFMRRIAKYPNAYDRLYRLGGLSNGRATVSDLVAEPGGHEMIEYLTSEKGGTNLGKMLSKTPKGKGFNKPTGRIFTEQQLLKRLQACHVRETQARSKANN